MPKKLLFSLILVFLIAPFAVGAIEFKSPVAAKTLGDVLNTIIGISLKVVLPIAVIIILFAAYTILTSQGATEKVQRGKKILTAGIAGLAIVIIAAGSSALFKNIFGIGEIGFEEDVIRKAGLDLQLQACGTEIEQAKQQLAEAQQKGDEKTIKSLSTLIGDAEAKQNDLEEQIAESNNEYQALSYKYAIAQGINIYDEGLGRDALAISGSKDEQGFYNMAGGGKFNPDTKEYIDTSGGSHLNCTLLYDGTILYQ